jgi:CRP/FNR family transcriptional regulator, cyclic AMP receptor protein
MPEVSTIAAMLILKDRKQELLRRVPLFSHCSPKELAELAGACDELAIRAGTELTREGSSGREFIVVAEGSATVTKAGETLNELGSGDFLGEIALLADVPRTATVTTTVDSVVLVLTARSFERVATQIPSVRERLLTALAERLQTTTL